MTRKAYTEELIRLNEIVRLAKENLDESINHPSLKNYIEVNKALYDTAQRRLELHIREHGMVHKKKET